MAKAILVGNGFSSMLNNSYQNCMMIESFRQKAPEIYTRIDEKYKILYDLKSNALNEPSFKESLYRILRADDENLVNDTIYKNIIIEGGLYTELDKPAIDGIETIIKVAKLFGFDDSADIEKIAIEICLNGGLNGINGINNDALIKKIDLNKSKLFFNQFNYIFTTNYDYILDDLYNGEIYHIHGGFDYYKIYYSDNSTEVKRYNARTKEIEMQENEKTINYTEKPYLLWGTDGNNKKSKMGGGFTLPFSIPFSIGYSAVREYITKLELSTISELHIFGYSGLNDNHINDAIKSNKSIETVIYYCNPETELENDEFYKNTSDKFLSKNKELLLASWDDIWEKLE
ncbi:MAG: hypothetical protein AB1Z23_03575 [Eubacteriales bacterium]